MGSRGACSSTSPENQCRGLRLSRRVAHRPPRCSAARFSSESVRTVARRHPGPQAREATRSARHAAAPLPGRRSSPLSSLEVRCAFRSASDGCSRTGTSPIDNASTASRGPAGSSDNSEYSCPGRRMGVRQPRRVAHRCRRTLVVQPRPRSSSAEGFPDPLKITTKRPVVLSLVTTSLP